MLEKKDKDRQKSPSQEAEEVKEILNAVSTQVPTLIKNILASVFSEEAGRSMGKAAGAFYRELKESGVPEQQALRMTEDYMKTFTGLSDMLRQFSGKGSISPEMKEELKKKIEEKVSEKFREKKESEEEEE